MTCLLLGSHSECNFHDVMYRCLLLEIQVRKDVGVL